MDTSRISGAFSLPHTHSTTCADLYALSTFVAQFSTSYAKSNLPELRRQVGASHFLCSFALYDTDRFSPSLRNLPRTHRTTCTSCGRISTFLLILVPIHAEEHARTMGAFHLLCLFSLTFLPHTHRTTCTSCGRFSTSFCRTSSGRLRTSTTGSTLPSSTSRRSSRDCTWYAYRGHSNC